MSARTLMAEREQCRPQVNMMTEAWLLAVQNE